MTPVGQGNPSCEKTKCICCKCKSSTLIAQCCGQDAACGHHKIGAICPGFDPQKEDTGI